MKNKFYENEEEQAFDKSMREAFEGFEMPAPKGGEFAAFERLQKGNSEAIEQREDAHLAEVFEHFELPSSPNDWKRLEADLDKRKHRPLAVWFYKGLEIALMTGVFALLFQWAGSGSNDNSSSIADNKQRQTNNSSANNIPNTTIAGASTASTASTSSNATTTNTLNTTTTASNSANNNNNSLHTNTSANTNSSSSERKKYIHRTPLATVRKNADIKGVEGFVPTSSANNNNKLNSAHATHANGTNNNNSSSANNTLNNDDTKGDNNNSELSTIALLSLPAIEPEKASVKADPITDPADFNLRKAKIVQPYVRVRKFGIIAGAEAHSRTEYGRAGSGFALGVFGEGDFSRLIAMQAGLQFSVRSFEQERSYTLDNTQLVEGEEGLQHLVSEQRRTNSILVQIPVQLQFSVFRNAKWRIYAQVGASAYFNLSQTYKGQRETSLQQTDGALRYTTEIGKNDYEGGLLQSQSLADNAYLSCQFGLGIDRQLTERLSLSVQPSFQQSLTRINKYGDKNQVISLQVGLKSNF